MAYFEAIFEFPKATRLSISLMLLMPILTDIIDMTFDLFYMKRIYEEHILRDPFFVKPITTAWMSLSILKFFIILCWNVPIKDNNYEGTKYGNKLASMAAVFVLEDGVLVFVQYFLYDKYSYHLDGDFKFKFMYVHNM